MVELLQSYSLENIFLFTVLLALAIKGVISFIDWAQKRTALAVHKAEAPQELQNSIEEHEELINQIQQCLAHLDLKMDLLIKSDKDDIKAFITREHHYFCYQKKWIDDYSLDCIERRYAHYKELGGNSFIKDLMFELRQLPKQLRDIEEEENSNEN